MKSFEGKVALISGASAGIGEAAAVLLQGAGAVMYGLASEATVRDQVEVNVFGLIFLTQTALPALERSRGTIVNVSSTSATRALPNQSIYGATKAAVESLTRALAGVLGPRGVRVNAISSGPTMTRGVAKIPLPEGAFEAMKERLLKAVPLGRMASSEEVARWLLLVADPSVTWLTGQVIGVDGGLSVT
jgi:NAD(P)-dependent dehydrogenase (short-subunit alcohol dehydrogenase family)